MLILSILHCLLWPNISFYSKKEWKLHLLWINGNILLFRYVPKSTQSVLKYLRWDSEAKGSVKYFYQVMVAETSTCFP